MRWCGLLLLLVGCAHGAKKVDYVNRAGKAVYFDFDTSGVELDEQALKSISDQFAMQVSAGKPERLLLDLPPEVRAVMLACTEDDHGCFVKALTLLAGDSLYHATLSRAGAGYEMQVICFLVEDEQFQTTCSAKTNISVTQAGAVKLGRVAVPLIRP